MEKDNEKIWTMKLSIEQIDLLNIGTKIYTYDNQEFINLPFWFKKVGDDGEYEIVSMKDMINKIK